MFKGSIDFHYIYPHLPENQLLFRIIIFNKWGKRMYAELRVLNSTFKNAMGREMKYIISD